MADTGAGPKSFFARPHVQLCIFTMGACLEGINDASKASVGDYGFWFWFFTASAAFFLFLIALGLWQRRKEQQRTAKTS